jgi:EF-P beta-lysylation protein EpmB
MKNSAAIIPVSSPECQKKSWKHELKNAFSNNRQLLEYLQIDKRAAPYEINESLDFPVRVPLSFAKRMKVGDPLDPLLLQVLANDIENQVVAGYGKDPLLEQGLSQPGLLHKYYGRVLFILSGSCAINCRYCFRRHFPYQTSADSYSNLQNNLDYVSSDTSISEVILSGGDPLLMGDQQLALLVNQLSEIPHVKQLRIHTRMPIVIPSRITEQLIELLAATRLITCLVVHTNHPNEIDDITGTQLQRLVQNGIPVLNQSVLLKDINNNSKTLALLSRRLFSYQILPYYLHLLDPVQGSAHFYESEANALVLIDSLRKSLPGFLVPRLAVERPGEKSKTILA